MLLCCCRDIEGGKIDAAYQQSAQGLQTCLEQAQAAADRGVKAAGETINEAQTLLRTACLSIRAFFTTQLRRLGVKVANLTALQDSALVPYAPLFGLLQAHDPRAAAELLAEYQVLASKYYERQYRVALQSLCIRRLVPLPPTSLLGDDLTSAGRP